MNVPKISILIANYNNGHFFKDCYHSLIAQSEQDWEAIIIDDCSTDNSAEIIERMIKDDTRFKFYKNEENIGYQKTIIKAIELSNASIFGRLDPDDALNEKAIELSVKAHIDNPNAGLVYSNFKICDKDLNEIRVNNCKQIDDINDEGFLNFKEEISHFATFKRFYYDKTSGIDSFIKRAEDKDIYMKMCEIAPVKHINEALYNYRLHDGGVTNYRNYEKTIFWHWVAIIKMADRRNINIEDLFTKNYVTIKKYKTLENKLSEIKKSRLLKLLYRLGIFKAYKYL